MVIDTSSLPFFKTRLSLDVLGISRNGHMMGTEKNLNEIRRQAGKRTDLPSLDTPYDLAEDDIVTFRKHGHVLLRQLASPAEVAAYRDVIAGCAARNVQERRPLAERDTYGKAFLQIENMWRMDDGVARFVSSPRFAAVAARLLGVGGVRLLHDQALFKEPGGGITPWHQDQVYWPFTEETPTVTMWMPTVPLRDYMGGMEFANGSQRHRQIGELLISDESEQQYQRFVSERGFAVSGPWEMEPGDATFHSGWSIHRAHGNQGDKAREVMTIIYFPDGAKITSAVQPAQQEDLATLFPGVEPGERAASALTPVLWPGEGEGPEHLPAG